MTAKSVIDIDVDQSKFEKFKQLYDKYSATLDKQSGIWKAVGKEQAGLGSHFERQVAAMHELAQLAVEELKSREAEEKALGKSERHWSSIASSSRLASTASKSVEGSVAAVSTSMLKWSGFFGGVAAAAGVVVAGFATAVELYEKAVGVAGRVGAERRTAQGFGMSIGEHRAFGLDFSRITDTDSFLGNVEEMMTDPSKSGPLWRAGINPNGSTTQVATRYMDWQRNLAVNTPVNRLGLLNQQYGMQVPIDTLMRLHNMSPDEYGDIRKQFETDRSEKGGLTINDPAARTAQNFSTQAQRADLQIENIFDKKVARLSGHLTDLSEAFVGLAQTAANTKFFNDALDKLGKGIDWLSKTGIPDFQWGVTELDAGLQKAGAALDEFSKSAALPSAISNPATVATGAGLGLGERLGEKAGHAIEKWFTGAGDKPSATWKGPVIGDMSSDSGIDLSNIVGDHPTSWNPAPISNSYAANRSNISNTTNNYGGRGVGSVNINIIAPPGFSATTTLAGLNAGLV